MTNLTMADVAEYFVAYKAKHNEDCTLSVDAIEQILDGMEDDDKDEIVAAMHEAQHTDDDRSDAVPPTEDDDTEETDTMPVTTDTSEGSAYAYAEKMDADFQNHLETLAQAALENKRGAAVIMFDITRLYGDDTVQNVWPVPGSKADNGRMIGNRLADKYKTAIKKEDGTTGEGDVSWYGEYFRYSPRGKALYAEKESLRAIGQKETGPHVLEAHKALIGDAVGLKRNKSRVDQAISNGKAAIVRAVLLAQRMALANKSTTLGAEISKEEDGQPAQSNKLVYIFNTEDRSKFDVLTIGQFLALKIEEGKKYAEIVGTVKRKPKVTATVDYTINNLDTFDSVTAEYATFFDKLEQATARKDMKAYNAVLTRLNAAGSDDMLLSLNKIMNNIEALLSKPGISDRLSKLLADPNKKAA